MMWDSTGTGFITRQQNVQQTRLHKTRVWI